MQRAPADIDVGMMVGAFRGDRYGVHHGDGRGEAAALDGPLDGGGVTGPAGQRGELGRDLVGGQGRWPGHASSMAGCGRGLLVVGAAILDGDGRLLAAQRAAPARYAGLWEFPGGKVEAGETPSDALVRECREELGVEIEVGRLVGEAKIDIGLLQVYRASIVSGRPAAREHQALRWLAPHEFDDVEWIAADRPLVRLLR